MFVDTLVKRGDELKEPFKTLLYEPAFTCF